MSTTLDHGPPHSTSNDDSGGISGPASKPTGSVLLLEDDEFDAAVTQELLERFCFRKYDVKRTTNLSEAIEWLEQTDFDVALIDLNVRDSSGLETLHQIIRATSAMPIIVLTGNEDIDTAIEALELGAQDYLPKSHLDSRVLLRVIEYAVQRKQKEDLLKTKAYVDTLTGLGNRAMLDERWTRSLERSRRAGKIVGILIADIDTFKSVNDTFGHDVGDMLLKDFSDRLMNAVRRTDIVIRFGGDEFVMVLESLVGEQDVSRIRNGLASKMPFSFEHEGVSLVYTASIGYTTSWPDEGEDLQSAIRRADANMYEIKALTRTHDHHGKATIVQ